MPACEDQENVNRSRRTKNFGQAKTAMAITTVAD